MKNQSILMQYLMLWPLAAIFMWSILPLGFVFAAIVAVAAVVLLFADKVMSGAQKTLVLSCWVLSIGAIVLFFYAFNIGLERADANLPRPWWISGIWALPLLGIAAFVVGGFLVHRFQPAEITVAR